ncbi:MAG: hypothetical protein EBW05_10935 [Betaproteobacteria bacterium]|nr:hypothetical protein [Betaproteobacteria bacterium]
MSRMMLSPNLRSVAGGRLSAEGSPSAGKAEGSARADFADAAEASPRTDLAKVAEDSARAD